MEETYTYDPHAAEVKRVNSDNLPVVITSVAWVSLCTGASLAFYGLLGANGPHLDFLALSIPLVIATPFLLAVSDIVRSLRTIAKKSIGG